MRLTECFIENFGKIKNKRIVFSEGLNCITEENGWGKSTLAAFIKVMLYGMSDTKRAGLDENDRKHYLPWDGSVARGTLTFAFGDKEYRIERSFAPKPADDTFTLYDTATAKVTSDLCDPIGEELFGIDADGFERTVFLSERALTPKSENKSVSAKLSDLVGCDGDIGVMDDAMKALDEERKFYYKKGGSGELANIKARVKDARDRLDRIAEVEVLSDRAEERLKTVKAELAGLYETRTALAREREALAKAAAKAEVAKRYEELKGEIASLTEKRTTLSDFFGGSVPTYGAINDIEIKLAEAKSLEKEAEAATEEPEYRGLKERFKEVSDKEIEAVKSSIFEVKRKEAAKKSPEYAKLKARFSKRIPAEREVDELIVLASHGGKKAKTPKGTLLAVGVILAVAAICLGITVHFALFALLIPAVICAVLSFANRKQGGKETKSDRVLAFYSSISDMPVPSDELLISDLTIIKTLIDRAEGMERELAPGAAEAALSEFARKLSGDTHDVIAFAEEALASYERYKSLSAAEDYKRETREKKLQRAEKLRTEVKAFTSLYPTVTDSPFSELREKLGAFERTDADIKSKTLEAEKFAKEHENDSGGDAPLRSAEDVARDATACDEKITEKERERTLTERTLLEYSAELEEKDELAIKLSELEESLEHHTENYNVVIKTKEFLEQAKDSMTAKYLGKTKAGFEKYAELISGVSGERFEMSTDFGVTRLEGAVPKSTEAYSRGTKDLYNLAARLGLIDSLYEGEEPFIILDDPFIAFDDEKTKAAKDMLRGIGKTRQIIYFTCSESRAT